AEDHLDITFGAGGRTPWLRVFPGEGSYAPKRTWQGKRVPKWLAVEDTLQPRGWSFEAAIPLTRVPGWSANATSVAVAISYHDADLASQRRIQDVLTLRGELAFAERAAVLSAFFKATKLRAQDVVLDATADVTGDRKPERVVAGGRYLGVIGDEFSYFQLPVASAADVRQVKLADLRGDGTKSILTVVRQHGNGGFRDVLMVWSVSASFQQVFAAEVLKQK